MGLHNSNSEANNGQNKIVNTKSRLVHPSPYRRCHNEHPHEEYRSDNPESESSVPAGAWGQLALDLGRQQIPRYLQMLFCCSHTSVFSDSPVTSLLDTYVWQFELTSPAPNNCIAVSIRPVKYSTKRIKELSIITPGNNLFCAIMIISRMIKNTVRDPTVIPNGNILLESPC